MKVAFLTTTLEETIGWGRYAAGFLAEARRRNGRENVVAPNPARLRSSEIRWKQPFLALLDALVLQEEVKSCDVIHAATEPVAPLAMMLSFWTGKPYVLSAHGTYSDAMTYPWYLRWLYTLSFRRASRILAVSRYTAEVVSRTFKAQAVEIVHGGFSIVPRSLEKRALSADHRVLSVGAIKSRKGFHTLVEAFGLLKRKDFTFKAECVGPKDSSSYVERLEKRVRELGLEERVVFHGRVSEEALQRFYADTDLFVLPSEHSGTAFEGLGLVYLEAMAQGVPVIGCLDSGAEDVVRDGVNGRLVTPGDAEALAAAIKEIFDDPVAWEKMATAAPESIERFRWENVGADMDAAYKTVVNERS
ncbi:MAG: glycosyltransferase [Patescibacteria group bacterium]|jgi:glycosyltransferase involved in cell wall biosynthesis